MRNNFFKIFTLYFRRCLKRPIVAHIGGGRSTNERPGSDHVIWGPMRGLTKIYMKRGHQTDIATLWKNRPRGPFFENVHPKRHCAWPRLVVWAILHIWLIPGALGVVVDSLLVKVELGVTGINGHRDGSHSPYSLLQVLGSQKYLGVRKR